MIKFDNQEDLVNARATHLFKSGHKGETFINLELAKGAAKYQMSYFEKDNRVAHCLPIDAAFVIKNFGYTDK